MQLWTIMTHFPEIRPNEYSISDIRASLVTLDIQDATNAAQDFKIKHESDDQEEEELKEEKDTENIQKEEVFQTELKVEDRKKIVLDETVYETELKLEEKKSFLEEESTVKPTKKHFLKRNMEAMKKKAFACKKGKHHHW